MATPQNTRGEATERCGSSRARPPSTETRASLPGIDRSDPEQLQSRKSEPDPAGQTTGEAEPAEGSDRPGVWEEEGWVADS